MKNVSKNNKTLFGFLIITGLSFFVFSNWAMNSHGFNVNSFEKIKKGMSTLQVQALMGEPLSIEKTTEGNIRYRYGSNFKWCMCVVILDKNNQVQVKFHDH